MYKVFLFVYERSIAHSPLGIIAVLLLKIFLGKFLLKKIPNRWFRSLIYAFFGAFFVIFDYSQASFIPNEFSKISLELLMLLYLSSSLVMYVIVITFILVFSLFNKAKK
jgi:hypothetical protein